jgi:CheY-like chemotaxis protein
MSSQGELEVGSQAGLKRLLHLDDLAIVSACLRRVLRGEWDVVSFQDKQRGLELLRSGEPFDLVVTDLNSPGLSGAAFLEQLRGTPLSCLDRLGRRVQSRPVGIFSASLRAGTRDVLAVQGALAKPQDAETLRAALRLWAR